MVRRRQIARKGLDQQILVDAAQAGLDVAQTLDNNPQALADAVQLAAPQINQVGSRLSDAASGAVTDLSSAAAQVDAAAPSLTAGHASIPVLKSLGKSARQSGKGK